MKGKMLVGAAALLLIFVSTADTKRSDGIKSNSSDKISHHKMLGKISVPHLLNYQGYITDAIGNPLTGTHSMVFSIWNAASGGTQLWSETQSSVAVTDGLFNVLLGSVVPIPTNLFTGAPRWLQIKVNTEILSPRRQIVSVGHAFKAEASDTAKYAQDANKLDGQNVSDLDNRYVNETQSNSITSAMIVDGAIHQADLSFTPGVGDGHSLDAADGDPVDAVYVDNEGKVGIGTESPGAELDVKGSIQNEAFRFNCHSGDLQMRRYGDGDTTWKRALVPWPDGLDINHANDFGKVTISGNVGIGTASPAERLDVAGTVQMTGFKMPGGASSGYVLTSDASGMGTWEAIDSTGEDNLGNHTATQNIELNGHWLSGDGGDEGVYVDNDGKVGIGTNTIENVRFQVNANGVEYGVAGVGSNFMTAGVQGRANGAEYGVSGVGSPLRTAGVYGDANGAWLGVSGKGSSDRSAGVYGNANGAEHGVAGLGSIGKTAGVHGRANGAEYGVAGVGSNLRTAGVYGEASGASYGVYSSGDMGCSGTKPAVVRTSRGPSQMYAMESPELWFEDFGSAKLSNGKASITLDNHFLETVTVDVNNPMKVFVQLNDECNGVYVKKDIDGFEVIELQGGKSNASFDYRVLAKRKGYETQRMKISESCFLDKHLYPDDNDPDIPSEYRAKRLRQKEAEDRMKEINENLK